MVVDDVEKEQRVGEESLEPHLAADATMLLVADR
jgi:hypothetical protein